MVLIRRFYGHFPPSGQRFTYAHVPPGLGAPAVTLAVGGRVGPGDVLPALLGPSFAPPDPASLDPAQVQRQARITLGDEVRVRRSR